jgi:hypothetical protein
MTKLGREAPHVPSGLDAGPKRLTELRLIVAVVVGLGAAAAVTVCFYLVGCAVGRAFGGEWEWQALFAVYGGILGLSVAVPVGIGSALCAAGRCGRFWPVIVGACLGLFLAGPLFAKSFGHFIIGMLLAFFLPFVGGAVGLLLGRMRLRWLLSGYLLMALAVGAALLLAN